MKIFRYNPKTKFPIKGLSVAMGNFDGLHIGHRSIIELANRKDLSGKFGVLTFDPHHREFFTKNHEPFRLMTKTTKKITLKKIGLDVLLEIPFTQEISLLEPSAFIQKVLHNHFRLAHVVVGEDFKFGHQRKGDAELLKTFGASLGIEVTIAPLLKNSVSEISSTAIRKALRDGAPEEAKKMLGEWYSIVGIVTEGDKRGRILGYPTLNLKLTDLNLPKFGVYSAIVKILTGNYRGTYFSAVSIGERPTYGKQIPNLEAHLLNFSENIYGEQVAVYLIAFQRPEITFSSSEELIEQMNADCLIAKKTLKEIGSV